MKDWTRRHPWQVSALIWASGVALVFVVQVLFAHASHSPVNWAEAAILAVIIPLVGSVGLPWGMQRRQQSDAELRP